MKAINMRWLLGGLLASVAIASPLHAQISTPTNPSNPQSTNSVSVRAADLIITPRAGVSYSTSGGGYDGFTSFQGFFPLYRTPAGNLLYLVGQLLLDNDANLGGNLLVGYRTYNPGSNRIFGGYLAYDSRDTGSSVFSQLGLGLETLGDGWDARLNAYVPVGNTRQTVNDALFDTGSQLTSFRFQNNFLLSSGTRQQTRIRDIEAAMAGFDVEAGGRLIRFSDYGDLRGYAGLYYISAGDSAVGVRGRLEARPSGNLAIGIAVQHDGILGTHVVGTVSLSLPGTHPGDFKDKELAVSTVDSVELQAQQFVRARMGEYPGRLNAIVVNRQREVKIAASTFTDVILTNPVTGQPYFFQHVTLGATGGNGTFENPFGLVQSALSATRSDGNDIVYVQAGTNPGIPAFTIPDRVQVLSTGVVQQVPATISGQVFPTYQLPLSGSGTLPNVNGTITMRSDTVLSGFNITSATGAGVTFSNVGRVEIRDNIIRNTADAGILGNGATNLNLLRNEIIAARNQGVYVQNVGTANVTDNRIIGAIAGTTSINTPITGDITIGSITIPNPGSIIPLPSGQGIVIATTTGNTNITRNTVTGTGTQGIVLLNATGTATITDNSVANTIGTDFIATVPILGNIAVPTGQGIVVAGMNGNLEISRNTVNTVRGQGLTVAGVTNGSTTISSNTIRNPLDQGMVVGGTSGTTMIANNQISDVVTRNVTIANPTGIGPAVITVPTGQGLLVLNSIGSVTITGNTIERVGGAFSPTPPAPDSGQGIAIANFAGQIDLALSNNQIRNNFNDGILIGLAGQSSGTTTAATANVTISGNTIENNGGATPVRGDGIGIGLEQDAVINNLRIENNTIRNNGDEGIDIRLGLQAIPILNPTTARLTGTIRNNTITNNGQNGVQVEARGGTTARVEIASNNASNNGQRGIFVTTSNIQLLGTPQISANIQLNTLSANAIAGFDVLTTTSLIPPSAAQSICVNAAGNTSSNASTITNTPNFLGPNVITVVNLGAVSGNNPPSGVTVTGTPAPVNTPFPCP